MLYENATVTEALDDDKTVQFTRMPVYGANIDDIVGIVNKRDLFQAERKGQGTSTIGTDVKPITRVSEKLPVQKLLDMFIKNREHLFLVEDEFGQTAGVVTLEDAIETLLGREIVDETDAVEDMQELARGNYRTRLRNNKLQDDN
jgi:CBS domain containing-hemolysin-like protein